MAEQILCTSEKAHGGGGGGGVGGVFLRLLLFLGTKIKDSGLDRDTWGLNFEVDSIQLQIISVRLVKNFW